MDKSSTEEQTQTAKQKSRKARRNRTNVAHGLASSSLLLVGMLAGELGVMRSKICVITNKGKKKEK